MIYKVEKFVFEMVKEEIDFIVEMLVFGVWKEVIFSECW